MTNAFMGTSGLVINATDTPNLTNMTTRSMEKMFQNAVNLTGNFSGWDTSKIETMAGMFSGATNFDQDVSSRDVSKVTVFTAVFGGTTGATNPKLSVYNYNALLSARAPLVSQPSLTF
jgi:surface protein